MDVIRTLIVDDEALARRTIRRLLEGDRTIEVVGECQGPDTPRAILDTRPDLLFLDVQMPGMSGLEALGAVAEHHVPLTVFVTAYDEYAVKAFELRAIDYLLKPFSDGRFHEALDRAKQAFNTEDAARRYRRIQAMLASRPPNGDAAQDLELQRAGPHLARMAIKSGGRVTLVRVEEVDWIEAVGSYVRLYAGDRRSLVRTSMNELEASLDPRRFFRIHRSAIVNLDRVRELQHWSHGDYLVLLNDGTELKLSRSRRAALEAQLRTSI